MTFIIWKDPLIVNRQQIYHYLPPLSQFQSRHRCANGNINNVLLFEGGGTFFKIWSVNCYYTSFITSNVCSFINTYDQKYYIDTGTSLCITFSYICGISICKIKIKTRLHYFMGSIWKQVVCKYQWFWHWKSGLVI